MKKKLFLIPTFVAGMALVACGGSNPEPGPEPEPTEEIKINFKSETLVISSTELKEGEDFVGTVAMKNGLISKYDMPVTLGNIQVQGADDIKYTEYTYSINSDLESAYVVIPGKFITNNLTITAEAKLIQHELIFTKSKAFEIVDPIVGKNEDLDTDINIIDEWQGYATMPENLEIYIGGNPLSEGQYDYELDEQKAHLHIDAWIITDDIIVESKAEPSKYTVKINGEESTTHLKISNKDSILLTDFNATISVTQQIYILPKTLKITVTDSHDPYEPEVIVPVKDYYYSSSSGALTIYGENVYGNITIEAEAKEADCILEVESSSDDKELLFYSNSGFTDQITQPIEIKTSELKEGYSIYVTVKNPTLPSDYIVPSTFDITVDGQKVVGYSVKYGGISPLEGDKRYATLTIQKDCVKGHVHVYGVGQEKNKHALKVETMYLTTSKLPEYITKPQAIECTFTPKGTHDLPLAENVNIKIDDVWYDGNGYNEAGQKKEGISYDATSGKLTIGEEVVSAIEKEDSDIVIIAKPADVSVLKELTATSNPEWETLHALSMYGYKLFTPGETTSDFYLDGYSYPFQARLIGFAQERGSTDTGYVQGLTLEFTTAISQVQYYQTSTNNNIYYEKNYSGTSFESNLYKVLNGTDGIVSKLPAGLKNNLYQVTKYGLTSDGSNKLNSLNYLYPLSLGEMNEKVITTGLDDKYLKESANQKDPVYDYYKQFKTKEELRVARIKGYQDKAAGSYWLRTPYLNEIHKQDYFINGINTPSIQGLAQTASQTNKGIAPAFCI